MKRKSSGQVPLPAPVTVTLGGITTGYPTVAEWFRLTPDQRQHLRLQPCDGAGLASHGDQAACVGVARLTGPGMTRCPIMFWLAVSMYAFGFVSGVCVIIVLGAIISSGQGRR